MSLAILYIVGATCELLGGGLAVYEIEQARRAWRDHHGAPPRPDEDPTFYIFDRIQSALVDVFTGNRLRRVSSIVLIAVGVVIGLVGNLAALS